MKVKVWDAPVRLFHALIIVLVGVSWWSGERLDKVSVIGLDPLDIHIWSGSTILALVLFRLVWGVVGSTTARFRHFVAGPVAVARYLRGLFSRAHPRWVGHNPLGGWSVLLLLALLLAMPMIGLFAEDEDLWGAGPSGPLVGLVDTDTAGRLADLHETLFDVLLVVVAIHVAAALFYLLVKRQNLIGAMITGRADVDGAETLRFRPLWFAALILAATGAAVAAAVVWLPD
jgi:cytochrome b